MLQWGHDQLIVEGEDARLLALAEAGNSKLQWGHDQLIVEGPESALAQSAW